MNTPYKDVEPLVIQPLRDDEKREIVNRITNAVEELFQKYESCPASLRSILREVVLPELSSLYRIKPLV